LIVEISVLDLRLISCLLECRVHYSCIHIKFRVVSMDSEDFEKKELIIISHAECGENEQKIMELGYLIDSSSPEHCNPWEVPSAMATGYWPKRICPTGLLVR